MSEPPNRWTERAATVFGMDDDSAAAALIPSLYGELRALAGSYFDRQPAGHTLQPTALVHEAFLRLANQSEGAWRSRDHFFAVAASAMRQILVSHARARGASKRGGGRRRMLLEDDVQAEVQLDDDLIALDEALEELGRLDERKARVVEAKFFAGLTIEQIADVLEVSQSTVEADWRSARAWLISELRGAS